MTCENWRSFLNHLPFPGLEGSNLDDVRDVLHELSVVMNLVGVDGDGILVTRVSPAIYRVTQEDPELLWIIFECCRHGKDQKIFEHVSCPLLSSILYWMSQRRRMPRIIMPAGGLQNILPPLEYSPFPMYMRNMWLIVHDIMEHVAYSKGIMPWMQVWQAQQMESIIVLTCYLLVGFSPPWNKHVPRSPFCDHVIQMEDYPTVVRDALALLRTPPGMHLSHVQLHHDLILQAIKILKRPRNGKARPHGVDDNPLVWYVADWAQASVVTVDVILRGLVEIKILTEEQLRWLGNQESQRLLFGGNWLEAVLPLSPDTPGELVLNPIELNSD
jgi:hypothetical protein